MASPSYAIQQIRRARRKERPPPAENFDEYRTDYEAILTAVRDLGGDPAIDEVTEWIVERIHDTGDLPHPDAVRKRARRVCDRRNVEIPEDSPL